MDKKRILIVTSSFPGLKKNTKHLGGAPFIFTEATALTKIGYEIDVIMPSVKGAPLSELCNGISVTRIEYPMMTHNPGYNGLPQHGNKGIKVLASQFLMSMYLFKTVFFKTRKISYDFLWSNWLQVGAITAIANLGKTPHMVSIRGSDVRETKSRYIKIMARLVPNVLNMYPDDSEIMQWIEQYSFKEHIVPGVYESKSISRATFDKKNITIIGRLDNEESSYRLKGLGDGLFDVLLKLMKERDDFSVTVVGHGRNLQKYRSMLSEYSERVTFTGWKINFDTELSQAGAIIGGSGMNGVIMDSVPNGIPVFISKNLTGSLWKHKQNCLVFDPDNLSEWAKLLAWGLDHPESLIEYAEQAKKDITQFALPMEKSAFEWDKVITKFIGKK